ncbi:MAG: cytochrome c [Sulfitobacter sp.]|jgi:cytochrome c
MRHFNWMALGFSVLAGPVFAQGHATGDAAAGEKVFRKCKSCHSVIDTEGEAIAKGGRSAPNLYGVFGRTAGTESGFAKKYGDSLVAAGAAGLQWNEADFVKFVADTKSFLKDYLDDGKARSKMSFKLKDADAAKDVWAYLVSIGPEGPVSN